MAFNFKQMLKENIQQTRRYLWESLGQLDEKAKYKEKGVEKLRIWDVLKDLAVDNPNNAQYFVHFSSMDNKIGINPQSTHSESPAGVYAYPLSKDFLLLYKARKIYGMNLPYILILKFVGDASKVYTVGESGIYSGLNGKIFGEYLRKLKSFFPEELIVQSDKDKGNITKRIWDITKNLSQSSSRWGNLLRKLGIRGFIDPGIGFIHAAESSQAVFFSSSDLSVDYSWSNTNEFARYKKIVNNIIDLYKNGKTPNEKTIDELAEINIANVVEEDPVAFDNFWYEISKRPDLPKEFIKKFSGYWK
jgi:hypothetical protein